MKMCVRTCLPKIQKHVVSVGGVVINRSMAVWLKGWLAPFCVTNNALQEVFVTADAVGKTVTALVHKQKQPTFLCLFHIFVLLLSIRQLQQVVVPSNTLQLLQLFLALFLLLRTCLGMQSTKTTSRMLSLTVCFQITNL